MIVCWVLFGLAALAPRASIADEVWKPYVCKVLDFYECEQGRKLIFPVAVRYSDKETCYREFERLFEIDKELDRKYPQTDDPDESYLFGCVKE